MIFLPQVPIRRAARVIENLKNCLGKFDCEVNDAVACDWAHVCSMAALTTPAWCVGVVYEEDSNELECFGRPICPKNDGCPYDHEECARHERAWLEHRLDGAAVMVAEED